MKGIKIARFVVHEHQARRLHYDLRLEIGGVLKSWALPKGPSLDPKDRRLAVMVPDHTLEYFDYEGIIPPGTYGAGPVVVWDSGEFAASGNDDPARALDRGKFVFDLRGNILKGAFSLVRMKGLPRGTGKEWLLMKMNDADARPDFRLETALTQAKVASLRERVPPCATE